MLLFLLITGKMLKTSDAEEQVIEHFQEELCVSVCVCVCVCVSWYQFVSREVPLFRITT
jgi:hypothetical protein